MNSFGGIFKDVFGEPYDHLKFEHRRRMQSAIYLLQELGVNFTDDKGYGFSLFKSGLWSYGAEIDAEKTDPSAEVKYSTYTRMLIDRLKNMIIVPSEIAAEYNVSDWIKYLSQAWHVMQYVVTRKNDPLAYFRKINSGYFDVKPIEVAISKAREYIMLMSGGWMKSVTCKKCGNISYFDPYFKKYICSRCWHSQTKE